MPAIHHGLAVRKERRTVADKSAIITFSSCRVIFFLLPVFPVSDMLTWFHVYVSLILFLLLCFWIYPRKTHWLLQVITRQFRPDSQMCKEQLGHVYIWVISSIFLKGLQRSISMSALKIRYILVHLDPNNLCFPGSINYGNVQLPLQ